MRKSLPLRVVLLLVSVLCLTALTARPDAAFAQSEAPAKAITEDLLSSVVRIKTYINPDGRTVDNLGMERDGSGIVIDDSGLVLTIGYLMVEAHAAELITNDGRKIPANVVGYDHDTGFGLLKAVAPLKVRPMLFGKSGDLKVGDPVLAASFGGRDGIAPAFVVSRREFAGTWEYLIDGAIYTAPAHSHWSGAALITKEGKLVGVGSLIVGDAPGNGGGTAGNMYVPTDLLMPIMADLIANGAVGGEPKPWIGLNTQAAIRRARGVEGHAQFSRRKGRAPQGRPDHQYRRRVAEDPAGILPQALVARRRRHPGAARRGARRQEPAFRRAVD